ncbi:MAG: right-handed parallel beta-helix repeat-containing protein [Bacteroidetes bacterium]|nr:right-handed parallel beta-helix repeat-containing protein [Bacteroidota bacterium]
MLRLSKTQRRHLSRFIILLGVVLEYQISAAAAGTINLYKGIVIRHSVTIKTKTYHFAGEDSLSTAPIIIEGDNIVVNFNGAVVEGSADFENPDKFKGTGVIVRSGKNIILKNLTLKGFKVGVLARNITGLKITGCDFSYNFRQHLNSNRAAEDLADWQSYHHNENDEWLRYGAGIYLRNCDKAEISNNVITNGQCGLMMTACNDGSVYNNDFSYNSGIGIGMYRSSRNRVMNNKLDWNVRGFSYGVYYRGQDLAGILVFEQCNDNIFAYNSVTHSGDGFFLWAGQSTMDTGEGGCNDNLVFGNDFSYAPTNGVEITFSRNKIIKNILHDCWHGIWGGFSYNTVIANNDFAGNLSAIAIEHGMNNTIAQNSFTDDKVCLELWSNPKRPKDIGYLQKRDTRSTAYTIRDNVFAGEKKMLSINNTSDVTFLNNRVKGSVLEQKFDTTVNNLVFDKTGDKAIRVTDNTYLAEPAQIPGAQNAMLPAAHPKGRQYIMMTEWGPYNFSYPILWWNKTDSTGRMHFDLMGPRGQWKFIKATGALKPSALSGTFPAKFEMQKDTTSLTNIDVEMEYRGGAIVSPFGIKNDRGHPYHFHYREFDIPYHWQMKWFAFDTLSDPVKHAAQFGKLLAGKPLKVSAGSNLDKTFGRNFGKNIPREKIATVSESQIDVPAGNYRVGITASEIVKVYIDDKLVLDNWDPAKIVNFEDNHYEAIIPLSGRHIVRVVQAQYGDYGTLNLSIKPVYKED